MAAFQKVETHPQKALIVQMLTEGYAINDVVRAVSAAPQVTTNLLYLYRQKVILPALKDAAKLIELRKGMMASVGQNDKNGNFDTAVDIARESIVSGVPLSDKNQRLTEKQKRHSALAELIQSRSADLEEEAAGGHTGLLARKLKATGVEYAFDRGVYAEMAALEKDIAIECGQWQEGATHKTVVNIVIPGPSERPQTKPYDYELTDILLPKR